MQRRGFLSAILAAGVAPAFIGSSVLMPVRKVVAPELEIIRPQSTILAPGHGLEVGALFTITGITGTFVATEILGSNVRAHPVPHLLMMSRMFPALSRRLT